MTSALATAWLRAAAEPRIADALEAIYADIGAEVSRRGPACWASGMCCRFEQAGHRLYVTGLEAAYTVARLGAPAPGAPAGGLPLFEARPTLTAATLADAVARGTCPFLVGRLCGAHGAKPLGCRVYFCDRSAQDWQRELSERMLARVRALHDEHAIEYRYGEWRSMLAGFVEGA